MHRSNVIIDWPHGQPQHRGTAQGRNGVVSCAHPIASQLGLQCLQAGGNAIDAIVTMAAVLSVVEPYASGIGGVGYMIIHTPNANEPEVLDFVGPSPALAERGHFANPAEKDHGIKSALIPSAVAGWSEALIRHGSISLADALRPAIELARSGFPASAYLVKLIKATEHTFSDQELTRRIFIPNGMVPDEGDNIVQADLSRTLQTLADGGPRAFYDGPIGDSLVSFSEKNGGLISRTDLLNYRPTWHRAISVQFRNHRIFCPPPPCSGSIYLRSLSILGALDGLEFFSEEEYLHYLIETFKLSVADYRYDAEENSYSDRNLSIAWAKGLSRSIKPQSSIPWHGNRFIADYCTAYEANNFASVPRESTTHMVAMDKYGNTAACTQTIGGGPAKGFGSGVIFGSTGILMNNFAHWFDWDPMSPNVIGPSKKVEMCLAPSIIVSDDGSVSSIGTPGSWRILQTTPQLLLNHLVKGNNVQASIEAARFCLGDGGEVCFEGRISVETAKSLTARGHTLKFLPEWSPLVGGAHGAVWNPRINIFQGGADPRRDGIALAY